MIDKEELLNKLNAWLDVLNYWDSDVCECAERGSGMNWYHKYETVQEEMYNMLKQLKRSEQ